MLLSKINLKNIIRRIKGKRENTEKRLTSVVFLINCLILLLNTKLICEEYLGCYSDA